MYLLQPYSLYTYPSIFFFIYGSVTCTSFTHSYECNFNQLIIDYRLYRPPLRVLQLLLLWFIHFYQQYTWTELYLALHELHVCKYSFPEFSNKHTGGTFSKSHLYIFQSSANTVTSRTTHKYFPISSTHSHGNSTFVHIFPSKQESQTYHNFQAPTLVNTRPSITHTPLGKHTYSPLKFYPPNHELTIFFILSPSQESSDQCFFPLLTL